MQYDKSLPEIEVHITKDGQEYTIPSGYSATIRWGKPDKHGCTATGTVSGSTVTFQVTEQMACVAGRSKVTVEIVESDSSQAGTAKFEVIIDSNPIGDNTIVSDSEIADIQKAIEAGQNADKALEKATAKANEASTSATTASQKAEEASASAQTAAEKAKEAKESADSVANVVSDVSQLKGDLGDLDGEVFNVTQEFKDCTADATVLPDKFVCLFIGGDGTLLVDINDGKDICDCYVISVNENDKFQVKGCIYNDNLYYPLIVMSSASFANNRIEQGSLVTAENGNYSYWGTGNETEIYEFVIPKGVKTLLVNKFAGESEFLLKKLVDVKKSKIPTKISELENDTLFLSREMYTPQYNIYTGQIRGSDDFLPVYDVKDDGSFQVTEMISVSKGDKIYYSGHFH